jgi:REP element-mobilizing transposase RayT
VSGFRIENGLNRSIEAPMARKPSYGFNVYAYVLMSNHVHLLIQTGEIALSRIMQGLQLKYTRYYNRKYKKVGHFISGSL